LSMYQEMAGVLVGGVPPFLALVGAYLPYWRRGFATGHESEPTNRRTWLIGVLASAALAGVLLSAGFILHLRATEDEALLSEDFWIGVKDGAVIIGVVGSGLACLLLLAVRKVIMLARGRTAYDPYDKMSLGDLYRMVPEEINALEAALDDARRNGGARGDTGPDGPVWAQAANCVNMAKQLHERVSGIPPEAGARGPLRPAIDRFTNDG
jgi:hypothetical protein